MGRLNCPAPDTPTRDNSIQRLLNPITAPFDFTNTFNFCFPGNYIVLVSTATKKVSGMQPPASTTIPQLEDHLGYWLRLASNEVSGAFARRLQTWDISVAQWVTMRLIHGVDGVAPGQVAEKMGVTRGAVSKIVERLRLRGFVDRRAAQDDGRAQILRLTPSGRRLLAKLGDSADQNEAEFFDCLSRKERDQLRAILLKLATTHQWNTAPLG